MGGWKGVGSEVWLWKGRRAEELKVLAQKSLTLLILFYSYWQEEEYTAHICTHEKYTYCKFSSSGRVTKAMWMFLSPDRRPPKEASSVVGTSRFREGDEGEGCVDGEDRRAAHGLFQVNSQK